MLEAKSLRKAVVPVSLLEHPSPGNLQSTRLALHLNGDASSCSVYIASGPSIYKIMVSMEDSLINRGKESLLIPEQTQVMSAALVNRCPHRSEIQSIVLAETESFDSMILGSVDSFGHLIVSKLDSNGKDVDRVTYSVSPQDGGVGEGSWAGLHFSPSQWSMAAVARSFDKIIDVYDQDIHLRTLRTLWYPTSLSFIQNVSGGNENSLLAVTEGCQLTMWDLRMKENSGCVHRITGSIGDIFYAVSNSSTGNIAVGGADRTVTIYDPRRWAAISRWVHCSKYEITGLAFSSTDSNYIYIQGVDYEVFCGQWKESKKAFSFKGDSNWLGFSKCPNRDILGGGVIQEASLWLTLARGMKLKRWKVFQMDYLVEYFSFHLISHLCSLWHRISLKLETLDSRSHSASHLLTELLSNLQENKISLLASFVGFDGASGGC